MMSMLKGMGMPKKKKPSEAPMPGMEEDGAEGEAPESEVEINLGDLGGEAEGEAGMEEGPSPLADASDEDLLAEVKKRGLKA
ncbi:MAG: hypothetical protein EBU96_12495 [Actinobacteria bacterium]|nr:hypothetical protein [Actinomycetota bacterium]